MHFCSNFFFLIIKINYLFYSFKDEKEKKAAIKARNKLLSLIMDGGSDDAENNSENDDIKLN